MSRGDGPSERSGTTGDGGVVEVLDRLAERLLAFGQHYRHLAQPLKWTFTRADLDALLARLSRREPRLRLAA
jgi:hypothetical protein